MNGFILWVGLGATLGLWRVWRSAPERQSEAWLNTGLYLLMAAFAGARLFYALENWGYFAAHPKEVVAIWQGGLSWLGAFAGAGLFILCAALAWHPLRKRGSYYGRIPLGLLGDRLYPLLAPLAVTAWIGCWQVGAAYGALLAKNAWWGIRMPDESGAIDTRFPLQPLAALTLLFFFWLLELRERPPRPPGQLSGLAIAGLLVHLLVTSLFIASPAPIWYGLRIDTWSAMIFLAVLVILIAANNLAARAGQKQSIPGL